MAKYFASAPPSDEDFPEPGLHVHHHVAPTRTLVVFVHGWNGKGYRTWRGIAAGIYLDYATDVALYDYLSGFRRGVSDSPSPEGNIDSLMDELVALTTYDHFVFLGHSMGGVITAAVLRRSHEVGADLHEKTVGMVSIASPRAGIAAIPMVLSKISDGKLLGPHSDAHARNFEFFENHVDPLDHEGRTKRLHIPHLVIIASGDRIVNRMTASLGLPHAQTKTYPGNHTTIMERSDVRGEVLKWVKGCQRIKQFDDLLDAMSAQRAMVTRFKGHPLHGYWDDAYREAVDEFVAKEKVRVLDASNDREGERLGLMVRVLRCEDIGTPEIAAELVEFARQQEDKQILALGISPYGTAAAQGAGTVFGLIGDASDRWISGTNSRVGLREEIMKWLLRTKRHYAPAAPSGPSMTQ